MINKITAKSLKYNEYKGINNKNGIINSNFNVAYVATLEKVIPT